MLVWTITRRLIATAIAAAVPNMIVGAGLLDVAVVDAALMSAAVAVLGVAQHLAEAYREDGKLTYEEIEHAFGNGTKKDGDK